MNRRFTRIGRVVVFSAAIFLGLTATLFFLQRDLIYPANKAHAKASTSQIPGVEELEIISADGQRLVAWKVEPKPGMP